MESRRTNDRPSGARRFRADVRLVRAPDRKRSGLQRGLKVIWLPDDLGDLVWLHGPDSLGPSFRRILESAAMLSDDATCTPEIDRNRMFLDAICETACDTGSDTARLGETSFILIGCGGLGSQIAIQLAALGARHFTLVDGDTIDASNLNRLNWANAVDIGALKAERLARHLAERFSCDVAKYCLFADGPETVSTILEGVERPFVILSGDDSTLARGCVRALNSTTSPRVPYLHVGYVGAFCMAGPLVADQVDGCPFCGSAAEIAGDTGFVAPSALANNALIAGFAVSQIAIDLLTGESALRRHRWIFNLRTGQARLRPVSKSPECKVCRTCKTSPPKTAIARSSQP